MKSNSDDKSLDSLLGSLARKAKMFALSGLAALSIGCTAPQNYVESRIGLAIFGDQWRYSKPVPLGIAYGWESSAGRNELSIDYFLPSYLDDSFKEDPNHFSLGYTHYLISPTPGNFREYAEFSFSVDSSKTEPSTDAYNHRTKVFIAPGFGGGFLIGNHLDFKIGFIFFRRVDAPSDESGTILNLYSRVGYTVNF